MDTGALAEAIREHHVVELRYREDERTTTRVVHPHVLYRMTNGGLALSGIQVAGDTRSGRLPAWRQFHLMRIVDARVLESRFAVAADFDPDADLYRCGVLARA